jgi:hypothetical protein
MIREADTAFDRLVAILGGCAFVIYHVLIDQHYRLSADDFSGWGFAQQGFPGIGYAYHYYMSWEGPFLSMLLQGLSMWAVALGTHPALILLGTKLALLGAFHYMLIGLTGYWTTPPSNARVWLLALCVTVTLYTISPAPDETWHWLIGISYLYPIIFLLIGVGMLIRGKIMLAAIPLVFVVHSNATFSTILFGAFLLVAVAASRAIPKTRNQWMVLMAILTVFLVVYLVAPGNYIRLTNSPTVGPNPTNQFFKGLQNLFVSYNAAKMDRVLLCCLMITGIAVGLPKKFIPSKTWQCFLPAAAYVVFVLIHEFLFVLITGYYEWPRVLSLHSFLFLIMTLTYSLWLWSLLGVKINGVAPRLFYLSFVGSVAIMYIDLGKELKAGGEMAMKYDDRNLKIFSYQGAASDTLLLDPITYHGKLYFIDFSSDPDNWINKDFRIAHDVDFKVAVRPEKK